MKVKRTDRLNGEYQREIYNIIKRLKNPDITEMFSVLRVEATSDLKYAKVYLSVFSTNKEKKQKTFDAIKSSAKTIRYELSKVMYGRTVPELNFIDDDSIEYANNMEKLFESIKKEEK